MEKHLSSCISKLWIVCAAIFIQSCQTNGNNSDLKSDAYQAAANGRIVQIRIHENESIPKLFDTTFSATGYNLRIERIALKSYVIQKILDDKYEYENKYPDIGIRICVSKYDKIILDTVIDKKHLDIVVKSEYVNNATISRYDFVSAKSGKYTFDGSISIPDSDDMIRFVHVLDLKNLQIFTKIQQD